MKAEAGFLTVSESGSDAVDLHQVAVGFTLSNGSYEGSYLQVGLGRSDLFLEDPTGRLKVDGLLTWDLYKDKGIWPFVQITVDSDLGTGADSIQTFIGLDFSIDKLFSFGD